MYHLILILSLFLFSCNNFINYNNKSINQKNDITVKNVVFKFDATIDYPIDTNDPRIKSILYVINEKQPQYIIIKYCNKRTKFMAHYYQNFFKKYSKNIKIESINNNEIKCKYISIIKRIS
jgi:hypothetical protein